MNNLKAGFARANINPPMGISIKGYFKPRFAEGILDDLEVNALALKAGDVAALLITVDNCGIEQELSSEFRKAASKASGVPADNIFISATVSHNPPL